jgi:cytochrome c-type biogenesis protein CcmF
VATTFPLISEALTGDKVTVGPQFYKAWLQPLGLLLIFLMGIGTLFGWKKTSPDALKRVFRAPAIAFVVAVVIHLAAGRALGFPGVIYSEPIYPGALGTVLSTFNAYTPVLGFSLCVFNAAVIVQEFVLLFRARARTGASARTPAILWWLGGVPGLVYTLFSLTPQSRRRYGGYIVHLGIVVMFVGFTGQSWNVDKEASLSPGQSYEVAGYKLTYVREHMEVDNNKRMVFAEVDVAKHGVPLAHLSPAKFIYKKQPDSPTTEVAIEHRFGDDIYVIVGSINPQTKVAAFQIHINPLVTWIWLGCFFILIPGSILCMWPQIEIGESRIWAGARGVAATAASVILGIMLAATPAAGQQAMGATDDMHGTVRIENDAERAVFSSVNCTCGCARLDLATCSCGTAEAARERIRGQMLAGETRDQIVAEYAKQFGKDALAVPPNTGAFRLIWAVPVIGIALGGVGLARMLRRWRKNDDDDEPKPPPAGQPPKDAYDARLDDELKGLDG